MFRSPEGYWHGFAARARVLIVNTELLGSREPPDSLGDLVDPRWRDQAGIAKPLFGTTATHAACLFSAWGPQKARQFFRDMKANGVKVLAGNKQVAQDVAAGRLTFGLTDTDDAIIELEAGRPVTIVYPDQGEGQDGTLFIPNTLAVIRGGPNPAAARRLVDALLAEDVESALARGPSAQIPLNPRVTTSPRVESPQTIRAMEIDFEVAADQWDTSAAFLRDLFATNE
jgi:iron(III) transport system substrate-binding protein